MSLLPKGEKLLKIATDTYFAASNGFKSFQKFLLELEKKGLIKSIKALQVSDRALLESIYNQGKTLHKSDPEKLAELKKAYEAGDLTKMEEILSELGQKEITKSGGSYILYYHPIGGVHTTDY